MICLLPALQLLRGWLCPGSHGIGHEEDQGSQGSHWYAQVSHVGASLCFLIDAATYAVAAGCAYHLKVRSAALQVSWLKFWCYTDVGCINRSRSVVLQRQ